MSAVVVNLFEADMTAYKFMVSADSIVKTILYFAVMYIVVMIFNSIIISRFRLIDLMHTGKKSERIKMKNPAACIIVFIIAAAALAFAYYNVGWKVGDLTNETLVVYIAVGSISTFLIFYSVSGLLLRVAMSAKRRYYRGLNSFTLRQISSRINTMVMSMTVICLMLFITICTLSAALSVRNALNENIKELCPADMELEITVDDASESFDVVAACEGQGFDITSYLSDYVRINTYTDKSFRFSDFCGSIADSVTTSPYLSGLLEDIVKISDYNALMELYGREKLTLDSDDEFILICNYNNMKTIRNIILEYVDEIAVFGKTLKSKYTECQDGFISLSSTKSNTGIFVVADSVVEGQLPTSDYIIGNYAETTNDGKTAVEKEIQQEYKNNMANIVPLEISGYVNLATKIEISNSCIGLGAIATFLGLYIGLVFLIACGAILALKQLSESVDSAARYEILRKIGAEESDISKSLFRQTGIFFLLPLLLACVHSVFGMKFAMYFLEVFGTENLWQSILATSVIILLIYGGYFLITYFCGKGIIKDRK
jgi:putative ABC transport system permease protein